MQSIHIYWLQLPNLPGGDLHGVRRPHPEDPRGLQRVQVHRVQHVGKDHLSIKDARTLQNG